MKKILLSTLLLCTISACTKEPSKPDPIKSIACNIGKTICLGISGEIANELQCKNVMAIQTTLVEALEKAKICEAKEGALFGFTESKSAGGNALCNSLGSMLLSGIVAGVIPASWECSADTTLLKLKEVVAKACGKIQ